MSVSTMSSLRPSEWALLRRFALIGAIIALTALVLTALLASTVLLFVVSEDVLWVPVLQSVVTVGFQGLAVGTLAGLVKLYLDSRRDREAREAQARREREARADELRELRYGIIRAVVEASHRVDNARLTLWANRSVKTWTEIVNSDLIPARTRLREVCHDLGNWAEARRPVFGECGGVESLLETMSVYLGQLANEYAEEKLRLAEVQRAAEAVDGPERARLLGEIWEEISSLPLTGEFVGKDGAGYGDYRTKYLSALRQMRSSLVDV